MSGGHSWAIRSSGTDAEPDGSLSGRSGRTAGSSSRRLIAAALVGLAFVGWAHQVEASSLQVTPRAAMGGTSLGLEITLEDPVRKPPQDVWLSIDPASGLDSESAVSVGFLIDPTSLSIGPEGFAFLRLYQHFGAGGERLVLFLSQGSGGIPALGAWVWDDSERRLVLAGRGLLQLRFRGESEVPTSVKHGKDAKKPAKGSSAQRHPRHKNSDRVIAVEVEWAAATPAEPGHLRVFVRAAKRHSPYTHSEGRRSGRQWIRLFERVDLDNSAQSLSYMQFGVRATEHFAGTFGTLLIDEVAVLR